MPVIAVDAMGGDFAPEEIVKGVAGASLATAIECVLVGDEPRIQAVLDTLSYDPSHIRIHHAADAVGMQEAPREALRAKRDASISVGAKLVAEGQADALVSAGNTGACLLACAREFRVVKGVRKPALASVYPRHVDHPGQDPLALLLDVGATVHCDAADLVQFAVMGNAWARRASKTARPKVGLLNMGAEPFRGGDVLAAAHERLAALPAIDFIGNVEGSDVAEGRADVIVCEGLLGSVVLKFIEGIAGVVNDVASYAVRQRLLWRLGMRLLSGGLREVAHLTEHAAYGGAPLLGFEQLLVKVHERSRAPAIANAVKLAAKTVRDGVVAEIAAAVQEVRA
ncbi:MAG: phosphate acyltransferase PlsX [Polyangiaceae bacterium UTPRO1]|jgi:glycerol-3-phosphate acyltransferase PlsX|nr:phosphate acyltransferase PlsX [Myxococcales bacterium]OQY67194.1 MAG: phosphate acyltransferase PlsX [Polyangiaceae bacterium UTPRO1]